MKPEVVVRETGEAGSSNQRNFGEAGSSNQRLMECEAEPRGLRKMPSQVGAARRDEGGTPATNAPTDHSTRGEQGRFMGRWTG